METSELNISPGLNGQLYQRDEYSYGYDDETEGCAALTEYIDGDEKE